MYDDAMVGICIMDAYSIHVVSYYASLSIPLLTVFYYAVCHCQTPQHLSLSVGSRSTALLSCGPRESMPRNKFFCLSAYNGGVSTSPASSTLVDYSLPDPSSAPISPSNIDPRCMSSRTARCLRNSIYSIKNLTCSKVSTAFRLLRLLTREITRSSS